MRRAELLAQSGCDLPRFKAWRDRGHLPFEPINSEGWQEFPEQAARALSLMVQLCDLGMTPTAAKPLIERNNGDAERVLTILRGQDGIHASTA